MSQVNPYLSSQETSVSSDGIRKIDIRALETISRGQSLIGDKFWLFLGITLVGVLLGSLVPMGIILGAMLVGIFLCFMYQEQGVPFEFGTLFRGFDYFKESLIAWILMLLIIMAMVVVLMLVVFAILIVPLVIIAPGGGNGQDAPVWLMFMFFGGYFLLLFFNILIYLPFMFVFQLIADRNVDALTAISLSFAGVRRNFFGVFKVYLVLTIISFVLAMMCYIPVFFFMPVSFATLFVLYRDIYGPGIPINPAPAGQPPMAPIVDPNPPSPYTRQ
ncbi:MAG: hypothetical protein MI861_16720 [Pirellulales bacterium]|nr:hypothetical protein [Pirellulales bacterium]